MEEFLLILVIIIIIYIADSELTNNSATWGGAIVIHEQSNMSISNSFLKKTVPKGLVEELMLVLVLYILLIVN